MRKRYIFITLIAMIIAGLLVFACKHPTGAGSIPGVSNEGSVENGGGEEVVKSYLSQEAQNSDYEYEDILFTGVAGSQIPALTVTAKEVLIAASGTTTGAVTIKRSSDLGMTWTDSDFTPENGYSYPFFINCHNGDILLGVTTATSNAKSETIFYRSRNDGETWTKQDSSSVGLKTVCNNATDGFATYGQGITLRHGGNLGSQKLMFPYYYNAPDKKKNGYYVGIMFSENDGGNFNSVCEGFTNSYNNKFVSNNNIGSFGVSYISKIIELANGDILLNMRRTTDGDMFWVLSKDCGKNWNITVDGNALENGGGSGKYGFGGKNADFIRYEFNGKDIKLGGDKYALMVTSYEKTSGYKVMLTDNDFNHGRPEGGIDSKYKYTKEITAGSKGGYCAITVLPDGTIATLTEDNNDMYFKRFNLYWLTGGAESINYSTDTSVKF